MHCSAISITNQARSSHAARARAWRCRTLGLALCCLIAAACKDKAQEPDPSSTRSAATAAPTAALKVAFLYTGAAEDGGWNSAHERARKALEARFGAKLQASVVEGKSEPADVEAALKQLINAGNTLIFATGIANADVIAKVAKSAPTVRFAQFGGVATAKNLSTYAVRSYEAAYMAGVLAGRMTKSHILGIVGSVPAPPVILDVNAFELGAQSINKDAKTKISWVNQGFDPEKEAGEAQALLNQGADVLFQTTQSAAVVQTAEKAGKLALGWGSDMGKQGPHAHLGSVAINWTPYYEKAVNQVLDGSWTSGATWLGTKEGAVDLIAIDNQIPPDALRKVEQIRAGLKDGSFTPFTGPIADQNGKELLAAGVKADDDALHAFHVYVRGIETNQ